MQTLFLLERFTIYRERLSVNRLVSVTTCACGCPGCNDAGLFCLKIDGLRVLMCNEMQEPAETGSLVACCTIPAAQLEGNNVA